MPLPFQCPQRGSKFTRLLWQKTTTTDSEGIISQSINILFYVCSQQGDIRHLTDSAFYHKHVW